MAVRIGDRYVAHAVIGHGSFGTVYRADGPEGPVAVELLRPDLARDPEVVNRFLAERPALSALHHPGIVPVRDLVAERDVLALVMPLVDGESLRHRLTTAGAMLPAEAARLVSEVAAALAYAHAHGVLHGAVTPEHVRFPDGRAVLTDVGVAPLIAAAGRAGPGTPGYQAPERVASPAADVYACGALLYELLTGGPPEQASPPRPAGVPEELWRVATACLATRPEDRPDADTLRLLLADWADQPTRAVPTVPVPLRAQTRMLPTVTPPRGRAAIAATAPPAEEDYPPAEPAPRRGWPLYAAALVAVAAVFLAAGFWLGSISRTPAPGAEPSAAARASAAPSAEPSAEPQARYLSELPFVQVANGWGPVELNRATGGTGPDDGGPLVLGGTTYQRGLGAHAPSHVRVYPPEGCTSLTAMVGIDGSSAGPGGGTVAFQVYVDGQLTYDSGVVTRETAPKPVEVQIAGATTVDLIVTDGGDGIHWDISDWADARLICRA